MLMWIRIRDQNINQIIMIINAILLVSYVVFPSKDLLGSNALKGDMLNISKIKIQLCFIIYTYTRKYNP